MFSRNKFLGKVMTLGLTTSDVAQSLGVTISTLSRKINGKSEFTRSEIQAIRNLLKLSPNEVDEIFFASELA